MMLFPCNPHEKRSFFISQAVNLEGGMNHANFVQFMLGQV